MDEGSIIRGWRGVGQKGRREQRGGQNDTQRWTKWHESGQFGRDRGVGTEIAIFKMKTFYRDRQGACDKRYRSAKSQKQLLPPLSPLRTLRSVHIGDPKAAVTPTDRKQRKIV